MTDSKVRTRIAPSPTGDWHLGNARTALFSYLFARHNNGAFFLRVEDTDRARYVEGSVERLLEVLKWLGMEPDPLPNGKPYFIQSDNLQRYHEVIQQLVESGLAYYCFATPEELESMRREQEIAKLPPRYDNRWGYRELPASEAKKRIAAGDSYVVRQKMPQSGETVVQDAVRGSIRIDNATLDDQVLLKSDGFPTYHLAHVVDDHDMEITHVIRGEEWLPSAPRHIQLYQALGWEVPVLVHVPVVLGPDKGKLSKRHGAKPITDYQKDGYLPDGLLNFLALLGWSTGTDEELLSREALIKQFNLEHIQTHPAVFNATKLDWFNAAHIRRLSPDDLRDRLVIFLSSVAPIWSDRYQSNPKLFDSVVASLQDRIVTLKDFPDHAEIFFASPSQYDRSLIKVDRSILAEAIKRIEEIEETDNWQHDGLESLLRGLASEKELKASNLLWTIRYCLTGQKASPGAFEMLLILGQDESLRRLKTAEQQLTAS